MSKLAVIGAGSWGTTFGKVLADGGSSVTVWARRRELAKEIAFSKRNSDYLPGINLPKTMTASDDIAGVLAGAEQIYIALPSQSIRGKLGEIKELIPEDAIVVSLMKGIERGTGLRMSEVLGEILEIPDQRIAVASGPNIALEIAREEPTAAAVSSNSLETAERVAERAQSSYFHSYVNDDVIGTEFGGALKNLIAVAVGIVDGVGFGENTKASVITRGLVEIRDLSVALGALPETMYGLAGLGDLIATCESPLSRNNQAGRLLGQGASFADVVDAMQQTAEGLTSITPVLELARQKGISMPITEQVAAILAGEMKPQDFAPQIRTASFGKQGE